MKSFGGQPSMELGNGEAVHFWNDQWVRNLPHNKVISQPPINCNWNKVADFISHESNMWDLERLATCVSAEEVRAISKIPISLTKREDKCIWAYTKSGHYTMKSGYHQSFKRSIPPIVNQASTFHSPSESMWKRLWAIPTMPKVCHFMWRIVKKPAKPIF
ncbi:hypothetical protein RHMOL_Rhmol01G0187000 [Rhododendron molle]|uniref:Uncharacterized protein n=1 Tax=Rhododendron molle TaxID=49168 RepID=A0ACC0Q6B2_RHOML|nr:hypothetical protein RHMOL_Rhmol01G0187000 [Rhododendron molle]